MNLWLQYADIDRADEPVYDADVWPDRRFFDFDGRRWEISHLYCDTFRDGAKTTFVVAVEREPLGPGDRRAV